MCNCLTASGSIAVMRLPVADRSSGTGDLICAIEPVLMLLLLVVVMVVGDAGRAALRAIFISITGTAGRQADGRAACRPAHSAHI